MRHGKALRWATPCHAQVAPQHFGKQSATEATKADSLSAGSGVTHTASPTWPTATVEAGTQSLDVDGRHVEVGATVQAY